MKSASQLMRILDLLAARDLPLAAATISRISGVPRSSTYRLLKEMEAGGYAISDGSGGWSLGVRASEMGSGESTFADALRVLEAFKGSASRLDFSAVRQASSLRTVSARRAIALLSENELLLAHEDGSYSLGTWMVRMAGGLDPVERLRLAATPVLAELRDQSGETANLLIRERKLAVYVEQAESRQPLRHSHWVGRRIPLEETASGQVLLGEPGVQVARDAVEEGVTAVACAVPGVSEPPAAVSLTGPSVRMAGERLVEARSRVRDAAGRIGEVLSSG